jgi:hypothetical protein
MTARHEGHRLAPDEERKIREAALDKTLADSFPASDPPSSNPNPADPSVVGDEPSRGRVPGGRSH